MTSPLRRIPALSHGLRLAPFDILARSVVPLAVQPEQSIFVTLRYGGTWPALSKPFRRLPGRYRIRQFLSGVVAVFQER